MMKRVKRKKMKRCEKRKANVKNVKRKSEEESGGGGYYKKT